MRGLAKSSLVIIACSFLAAFNHTGGQQNLGNAPSQPTLAATNGFNNNVFYEDFCHLSDIDINNTHKPGFHLYNQIVNYTGSATPVVEAASSYSISNCVLTYTPTVDQFGGLLTPGYIGPGAYPSARLVGPVIAPTGGYVKARFAFNPALSPGSSGVADPTFGFQSQDLMLWIQDGLRNSFPYHACEMDVVECYIGHSSPGQCAWVSNPIDWNTSGGIGALDQTSFGTADTSFHTYEMVWVIPEKNGGTGFMKVYLDGVLKATTNYTNPGNYSCMDYLDVNGPTHTTGFNFFISTGIGWPIQVTDMEAWQ